MSGFKPEYTASEEPAPASEEEAPKGTVLSEGWLKKTGKGLKAKTFEGCFVTLRSDPLLAFHTPLLAFAAVPRVLLTLAFFLTGAGAGPDP